MRDCNDKGHCWHTINGSLFRRGPEAANVHCCWCTKTHSFPANAQIAEAPRGEDVSAGELAIIGKTLHGDYQ